MKTPSSSGKSRSIRTKEDAAHANQIGIAASRVEERAIAATGDLDANDKSIPPAQVAL